MFFVFDCVGSYLGSNGLPPPFNSVVGVISSSVQEVMDIAVTNAKSKMYTSFFILEDS